MALRILVIDDDLRLFRLLEDYLGQNGIVAERAPDGEAGLHRLTQSTYDAVLLDVMMPKLDGLAVLRELRKKSAVPVIMLTAKGDETDRVVGLETGADDYLPKPFSPRELLARLRAVLRRGQTPADEQPLSAAGITLSVTSRSAQKNGVRLELTGLEFDLLTALVRRAGRIVSRSELLNEAGRSDVIVGERAIDVHISHLRKKLGDSDARLIKTVRGIGYVLSREET
jgi:DNA-binding response OmpR family regulator